MAWTQPEPKTQAEKANVVSEAMGGAPKSTSTPTGGKKLHRIEIEPAENGYSMEVTHKTPVKTKGGIGMGDFDHHDYEHTSTVHQSHGDLMKELHKHVGGDCPGCMK